MPRPASAPGATSNRHLALLHSLALAIASLVTYWLTVHGLARVHLVDTALGTAVGLATARIAVRLVGADAGRP